MTLHELINDAANQLQNVKIPSAYLDAELLLAHVCRQTRSWTIAHASDKISTTDQERFLHLICRRANREPVAYITGHKEFYGRDFVVTPDVLIPRPESEIIIDLAKKYLADAHGDGLDIGTGSGALGITLSLELPHITMTLSDISPKALTVAHQNASALNATITSFVKSDLLKKFSNETFMLIVANLPYVDTRWTRSPETAYEPDIALFADDDGLELIKKCIHSTQGSLVKNGYLILESDPCQQKTIRAEAMKVGLRHIETVGYCTVLQNA